jgi:hypothetical protein
VTSLSTTQQLEQELNNVQQSVTYAREQLGLA